MTTPKQNYVNTYQKECNRPKTTTTKNPNHRRLYYKLLKSQCKEQRIKGGNSFLNILSVSY